MCKKNLALVLGLFIYLFFLAFPVVIHAASATIAISPNNGSITKEFPVSIIIDGHGEKFNAAEATVSVSKGLLIKDLVLGDCNFSFLLTPSIASPSFQGVILGGSSKKCTLYTLTLIPTIKGNTSITLDKASVRRSGDAVDILQSVQNGSYINAAVLADEIVNTPAEKSKDGLYTVTLKIVSPESKAVVNTDVVFKSAVGGLTITKRTEKDGIVSYSNLQPGIYTATIRGQRTIINLVGKNHELVLGIKLMPPKSLLGIPSINLLIALGVVVLVGICLVVVIMIKNSRKTK